MYQFVMYGYVTYRLYHEYHDVIYCVKAITSGVSGMLSWFHPTQNDDEFKYVDWILVIDQEPVKFLQPSAPPLLLGTNNQQSYMYPT